MSKVVPHEIIVVQRKFFQAFFEAPFTLNQMSLITAFSLWKPIKCFPSTLPEKFENAKLMQRSFPIRVWKNLVHGNHILSWCDHFRKGSFYPIAFRLLEDTKLLFSNSFSLKSIFDKFPFRDELVWTVGLTVEIKLRCVDGAKVFKLGPSLLSNRINKHFI